MKLLQTKQDKASAASATQMQFGRVRKPIKYREFIIINE